MKAKRLADYLLAHPDLEVTVEDRFWQAPVDGVEERIGAGGEVTGLVIIPCPDRKSSRDEEAR